MSDQMMKAIRYHDFGGPEVLVLEQVPCPQPQAGQVLVRVLAAGVNPADWKMRAGLYKSFMQLPLPMTPGLEAAGIVEAVGQGVTKFRKGQAVYGAFMGAYAEYALAAAGDLQEKPANLSFDEAASVPVGALTAWQAVVEVAKVKAGQRVLVHGAAGGVGLYALQFARWKGASVTGTASAGNLELVRSLGAEKAVDYAAAPFENVVKDMDVVVDTVGGDLPERSLKVLHTGGILVTVAGRLDPEMGKAQGVQAVSAGRAPGEKLSQISELLGSKVIKPAVGKVFQLSEARQAQELCQTGHGRGRIILHLAD
jgi:NADPH:quinone reductase-like Zn-dependent oxidoreductase